MADLTPNALAQTATVNNVPFTIVGVAPRGFFGVSPGDAQDVYLPMHASLLVDRAIQRDPAAKYSDRNFYWVEMMGRLRPGATVEQAQGMLGGIFRQFAASTAANESEKVSLPQLRVELVPLDRPVDDLIPIGLTHRPELASQQALVQAALSRIKQERLRPLVPSLILEGGAGPAAPGGYLMGGVFASGAHG